MRSSSLIPATAVLLFATGCAEREPKVLFIGIDGVRSDVLADVHTPNIDELANDGLFVDSIQTKAQTISGPAWSSMLTGVWPDKHLVVNNDFSGNNYAEYPDFLTRLERVNPQLTTFAVLDWPPLGTTASGGPLVGEGIDMKINVDGEGLGYRMGDSLSVAAAIMRLSDHDPDAAFVYLGYPDVAAHDFGGLSPEYTGSIQLADALVGELLRAVRSRPTFDKEDWLILVCTDHGHRDEGGHGGKSPEETTVFYLASGPSASRRSTNAAPNLVDVAVTAMAHLGVTADTAWHLDGRIMGLKDTDREGR
jgi:predicted AlkP superfamily pyrophosphatase or phosphodiesterase